MGGPLALLQDGDVVTLDVEDRALNVRLPDEELARRRDAWRPMPPRYTRGVLAKYAAHGLLRLRRRRHHGVGAEAAEWLLPRSW